MPSITIIENCDFESHPVGGQISNLTSVVKMFPDLDFRLVGIRTDGGPVRRWVSRQVNGRDYPFIAVGRRHRSMRRPLVPERLRFYAELNLSRRAIQQGGRDAVFLVAPESLLAVKGWGWGEVCYTFSGVYNPLERSRYRWAKVFAQPFDRLRIRAAAAADVLLAHADEDDIRELVNSSRGVLADSNIIQVPTTFDAGIFKPVPVEYARHAAGLPSGAEVFVCSGRLSYLKGWDLVLDAFAHVHSKRSGTVLVFVGDGEDKPHVQRRIAEAGLDSCVFLAGRRTLSEVSTFLNAGDVVVFGSRKEGWCTAMVEALACGKRVVSTDVGGATRLITTGRNGYVVPGRSAVEFAEFMIAALSLPREPAAEVSIAAASMSGMPAVAGKLRAACRFLNTQDAL